MRPPVGAYSNAPGPRPEHAEGAAARLAHLAFYDPDGNHHPLPTYPWGMAPEGMATKRQLRKKGLRPGGQEIRVQVLWWHGGVRRDTGHRERRVAYLYVVADALPVRPMTPGRQRSVDAMLRRRRTCQSCGQEKPYCISRSLGECNECADYARGAA